MQITEKLWKKTTGYLFICLAIISTQQILNQNKTEHAQFWKDKENIKVFVNQQNFLEPKCQGLNDNKKFRCQLKK